MSDVSDPRSTSRPVRIPPLAFEYWYYAQAFYAVLGSALGVSFNFVGVSMLALLAMCCVLRMGSRSTTVWTPIGLPLAFGASYLAIQLLFFREPIMSDVVRSLVPWIMGVVIIQCLALRRGFLHRFTMAMFVIGLCTLPYLTYRGSATRLGLQTGLGISNQNDLGAWFGFCCLYFAVLSLETRRLSVRLLSGIAAMACLYIVALTVSRAPLLAAAVGIVVALRRMLKHGFFSILSLAVVAWIAYGFGLFDRSGSLYAARVFEETGRFLIWPAAIERFFTSPLMGFGGSDVATFIPQASTLATPHNQFIFIALASGLLPLLLFVAYWVHLGAEAVRLSARSHEDAVFLVPLFVYVCLIGLELNQPYMAQWAMATTGTLGAAGFLLRAQRRSAAQRAHREERGRKSPSILSNRARALGMPHR